MMNPMGQHGMMPNFGNQLPQHPNLQQHMMNASNLHSNLFVAGLPEGTDDKSLWQLFETQGNIISTKYVPEKKYGFVKLATQREAEQAIRALNGLEVQGTRLAVRFANNDSANMGMPHAEPSRNSGMPNMGRGFSYGGSQSSFGGPVSFAGSNFPGAPQGNGFPGGVAGGAGSFNNFGPPPPLPPNPAAGPELSDNLYIKGLPPNMTDSWLRQIFDPYGNVVSTRILQTKAVNTDPSGESIALIRFGQVDQARWLVDHLNGNIPQGLSRPITVRYADSAAAKAHKQTTRNFGDKDDEPNMGFMPMGMNKGKGKGGMQALGHGPGQPMPGLPGSKSVSQAVQHALVNLGRDTIKPNGDGSDPSNLYVKALPPEASELYLYKVFAPIGAVESVYCMVDNDGFCSGIGFVKYARVEDAQIAISAVHNLTLPDGVTLNVSVKKAAKRHANSGENGNGFPGGPDFYQEGLN